MSILRCDKHGSWDSDVHEQCPLCEINTAEARETMDTALKMLASTQPSYSEQQKHDAFEWLRYLALNQAEWNLARPAAVMLSEIANLKSSLTNSALLLAECEIYVCAIKTQATPPKHVIDRASSIQRKIRDTLNNVRAVELGVKP